MAPRPATLSAAILFAAAALLNACSHNVYVSHLLAPARLPFDSLANLSRIMIVTEIEPDRGPAGLLGSAVIGLAESLSDPDSYTRIPIPHEEARLIMEETCMALHSPVSRVAGYMTGGVSSTVFADALGVTAVLWVKPGDVEASQEPIRIRDREGERTVFGLRAGFTVQYRLESWPDRRPLASGAFEDEALAQSERKAPLRDWARAQTAIRRSWLAGLQRDLLPIAIERSRKLQKGKAKKLKDGYRAARKGMWEEASRTRETEREGFQASWNLGIHHERRGEWEQARTSYARALDVAPKAGQRRALARYLADLEEVHAGPLPAADARPAPWFGESFAVIPFANESANLGAPERVRKEVEAELARKGYAPLPAPGVDSKLKDIGLTQGGQLKAFAPEGLARALGARFLLTGRILNFKTVNTGLYNLNTVSLEMTMFDDKGTTIWTGRGVGYREVLTRPEDAGKGFLWGLAETAVTKAARIHLELELETAVAASLAGMPSRPGSRVP